MQPEDLFRAERVGVISWVLDRSRAAVELRRSDRWLDRSIPTGPIVVVDAAAGTLRPISPASREFVGFFGPAWSPDSRRLLFFSVDTNAVVRPWVWTVDAGPPTLLRGLLLQAALADPPVAMWSDPEHAVLLVRDSTRPNDGPFYFKILRGRNVADGWVRAREGRVAAVSVLDSRGLDAAAEGSSNAPRIVSVNVRTQAITTLVQGWVHRPLLSPDGRTLTYRRENPPFAVARVATFFGPDATGEAAYDKVNWGSDVHHVDSRTGAIVPPPDTARPGAAATPTVMLQVVSSATEGTRLTLVRPGQPDLQVWHGNAWVSEIATGRAEAIAYTSAGGTPLTGWLLYPPRYVAGQRMPIVTVIYPGSVYSTSVPSAFDILNANFEHPQLFAALGYGVVLPSMPLGDNPLQFDALDSLSAGVLPLLDTLVARGLADSRRVAVLGQSAGGWATLGLIATTDRFRSAIASAASSDLASLYGTFYGQYRHGDAGDPKRAQVLRMLQFERGYNGAGAPPWQQPEGYRTNSPIWRVTRVRTPLMLVHGELDFVSVQQAEEYFTALYRQDKHVRLVRYAGEEHTISARANVLDLWHRFADWLRDTMPVELEPDGRR